MSIPTPLETTGEWTTWDQETQWLTDIQADTGRVSVTQVGTTVGGRPIRLVGVGVTAPDPAAHPGGYLVLGYHHGDEPAGRDGALSFIRELAYTTDPVVQDYLAAHPVFVVPTINADRVSVWVRETLNMVDPNRDHLALTQPEARAVADTLTLVRPAIAHDMHENNDQAYDVELSGEGNPEVYPGLHAQTLAIRGHAEDHLDTLALTHGVYPTQFFPNMFTNTAALRHIVPLLSETNRRADVPRLHRVRLHRETGLAVIDYHRQNVATVDQARAASRLAARNPGTTFQIGNTATVGLPTHYRITDAERAAKQYHLDTFRIATEADGADWLVPTAQEASGVIPYLMDPASTYKVFTATPENAAPGTALGSATAYGPVRVGGVDYDVTEVLIQAGGQARTVWTP